MTRNAQGGGPSEGAALAWAVAAALCAAAGLGASGQFRAALALTLGAAVAIVSARWLKAVTGRLLAPDSRTRVRLTWKFGLGALLRYLFVALGLFGAVRLVPGEIPWLLAGLSAPVVGVLAEGIREVCAERRKGLEREDRR